MELRTERTLNAFGWRIMRNLSWAIPAGIAGLYIIEFLFVRSGPDRFADDAVSAFGQNLLTLFDSGTQILVLLCGIALYAVLQSAVGHITKHYMIEPAAQKLSSVETSLIGRMFYGVIYKLSNWVGGLFTAWLILILYLAMNPDLSLTVLSFLRGAVEPIRLLFDADSRVGFLGLIVSILVISGLFTFVALRGGNPVQKNMSSPEGGVDVSSKPFTAEIQGSELKKPFMLENPNFDEKA